MERASRVCATCKARKKGCDKVLPYCGYCTRRGILCSYEYASPESSKGPERVPSSLASAGSNVSLSSSPFPSSDSACSFSGLENSIQLDIHNIFSTTARAFPEVCDQYFGSFHRWLPIVSQELLLQATATNLDGSPPLDLSLLVLSIYLVTLNPSDENEGPQMSPQKLYVEIRVLLAKLQIMLPASVYLAQATLLVAAYEYACGRPHASYVSIGVCARMLSILRLDRLKSRSQQVNDGSVSDVKSLESQNLYWGIIMLERLVANECPSDHLKPSFRIPSPDTELPSDLIPKYFTISPIPNEDFSGEVNPTVGDLQSSKVGSFGRQIQAICFLDQVLEATNEANPAPISILLKLDEKLWGFLAILMDQSSSPRHHCGANGIMVRSLVRLHQHILKESSFHGTFDAKIQEQSHAALDTLSRMMIEVAHDHLERFVPGQIDSLPLSCSYNMRSMMELIKDRWRDFNDHGPLQGLEAFAVLHRIVSKRWRTPLDH